jgi:uncharacterized protein (DUF342 family)
MLEVLRQHPGMTENRIRKLETARRLWLQRNREKRFAAAALRLNWLRQENLDQAFEIQKIIFQKNGKMLGLEEILVQKGFLRPEQQEAIARALEKAQPSQEKMPEPAPPSPPSEKTPEKEKPLQEDAPSSLPGESLDEALILHISEDNLEAFIEMARPMPESTTAQDILTWIQAKDIAFGLVDISLIEGFIKFEMVRRSRFKVAQGKAPQPGRDGSVRIHFPSDFLSSGAVLSEDGRIDFRQRGSIPHVAQGTLLAEKTPAIKGQVGIDVFGHMLPVEAVIDPPLKPGTGVYTSEDRTKIFAKINGQPTLRASGEVSVIDEILIKGDVGYETGHIQYGGKVRILGKIPAGFRVEAHQVTAESVDGGLILAKGEVVITSGVTEGEIHTEGDVRARFINKSKIRALGNVVVVGEVIDADIACSGGCDIRLGKVISSRIAARQGIEAHTIGTEVSPPSTITIGVDLPLQEKLAQADKHIQQKRDLLAENQSRLADLEAEEKALLAGITESAQIQDRSGLRLRLIEKGRLEEAETHSAEVPTLTRTLKAAMDNAEKKLAAFFSRQDALEEDRQKVEADIQSSQEALDEALQEKKALEIWSEERQPIPLLRINGKAHPGTRIVGPKAQAALQEICSAAMIREVEISDAENKEYVIRIVRQRP